MKMQKRIISFLISLMLCIAIVSTPVSARSSCEGVVTASSLNLRSGAGVGYTLIATAQRGATLTVIGVATEDSSWFKVNYNGLVGYMDSNYIINSDSSEAAAAIADAAAGVKHVEETPAPAPVSDSSVTESAPVAEVEYVPVGDTYPEETPAPVDTTPVETAAPAPVVTASPEDKIYSPGGASNAVIKGDMVRFRATPGGDILGSFHDGTRIYVESVSGVWAKVNCDGQIGYVNGNYVTMDIDVAPVSTPAAVATAAPTAAPAVRPVNSTGGQAVVDTAMQFLGVPYVWAGTSPSGFDCSGLCYYVYQQLGYTINRVAHNIYTGSGYSVSLNNLAPGDIVCFGTSSYVWHVGIYVGNNQFIHAPNTGAVVRVESISGTYLNNFVCGKRIL